MVITTLRRAHFEVPFRHIIDADIADATFISLRDVLHANDADNTIDGRH